MDFEYIVNPDNTFALYNNKIEDIYFSNIGAYKEAIEKFVIPSFPKRFENKTVKILDVCYGMGYNSKSFVDYCIKNNINCNFEIDCIEIDKNILALGLLIFDENILDDVHLTFGKNIISQFDLTENLKFLSGENWIKFIFEKFMAKNEAFFKNHEVDLYKTDVLTALLHNIYYQNLDKLHIFSKDFLINFILDDLLKILPDLNKNYDLIFHDAFSIKKQPELWSEQVMRNYYRILDKEGMFLTYSNSRVLKRLLSEIGFKVKTNFDSNEKMNGTIGIK